jgi:hypothetical protein
MDTENWRARILWCNDNKYNESVTEELASAEKECDKYLNFYIKLYDIV